MMSPAMKAPLRTSTRVISRRPSEDRTVLAVSDFTGKKQSQHGTDSEGVPGYLANFISRGSSSSNNPSPRSGSPRAPSVTSSSSTDHTLSKFCQWSGCNSGCDIGHKSILVHIQEMHVLPQLSSKKKRFACWWNGCKVYGQPSVSSNWLTRHVQQHTDAKGKPFSCIFDRCNQRFSSSSLLERHIQRDHMRQDARNGKAAKGPLNSLPQFCVAPFSTTPERNPVNVKSCARRGPRRRRKMRCYRVHHVDFYDSRSKVIIKNRIVLDKILTESAIEKLIRPASPPSPDAQLSGRVALPGPITDAEVPVRRVLRSAALTPDEANKAQSPTSKPKSHRVKLLLTVPHTFVGQRLTRDNKQEYLVKWQGDLCADVLPVMWVLEEEIRAAATLDKL